MPSNGTDGCIFEDAFCNRCQKDVPEVDGDYGDCAIHTNALIGIKPPEWVQEDDGTRPRCTAFEPIRPVANPDPLVRQPGDPDMPGQQSLFTETP